MTQVQKFNKHTKIRKINFEILFFFFQGTRNGESCTLILTEGDSAKALAMSGIEVVGRDKYGVFPLKGKMLNVRDSTTKSITENVEI